MKGVTHKPNVGWIAKKGEGGLEQIKYAIGAQKSSRAALREVQREIRRMEVCPMNYTSLILQELDLPKISNLKEVRQEFPQEISQTAGYPVMCFKYDVPLGVTLSNEKKNDDER